MVSERIINQLPPPKPLTVEGNVAENWRQRIQQFRLYLTATGIDKKPLQVQCSSLLTVAGEEEVEIFNTFGLRSQDAKKIDVVSSKFEEYCTSKKKITYEQHIFNTRAQGVTEAIEAYITELRKLTKSCEFGELLDSLNRNRIVCSIRSNALRKRLLRGKDLNLERAVEICKSAEITDSRLKNIALDQDDRGLHAVKDDAEKPSGNIRAKAKHQQRKKLLYCKKCGQQHPGRKCAAYGQICHECKQRNHYAKICLSKSKETPKQESECRLYDSGSDELFIGVLETKPLIQKDWRQRVVISQQAICEYEIGHWCSVQCFSIPSLLPTN